jgi:methionine biosynthesis protein MetW
LALIAGGQVRLREYPDHSFDYVIMNQSMQEVKKVDCVIHEAMRIGNKVIVGFPKFAYIKQLMLFFQGKSPITGSLPYLWFDTPNVRFLSITDFKNFCEGKNIRIVEAHYLGEKEVVHLWPNLLALNALFVLTNNSCGVSIFENKRIQIRFKEYLCGNIQIKSKSTF